MALRPHSRFPESVMQCVCAATQRGDRTEQNVQLQRLQDMVEALADRPGADASEVRDSGQVALIALLKAAHNFRHAHGKPFARYARKVMANAVRDKFRAELRANRLGRDRAMAIDVHHHLQLVRGTCCPPPDLAADEHQAQLERRVRDWVNGCPPRQRELIELCYDRGMKPAEAARTMGISRAAVKKLHNAIVTRGRKELSAVQRLVAA